MGLEDTGARMSRLGGMLATLGHVIPVDEQIARWERVTHADVRRVIDRVYGAASRSPSPYGPPRTDAAGEGAGAPAVPNRVVTAERRDRRTVAE